MSPSCRVRIGATSLMVAFALCASVPAWAQFVEEVRRSLDFAPDPLRRSPRLLGMGRLTLVVDEANNRISLWDFAGNPVGILDDTTSTLELRPSTASSSAVHDLGDALGRERQDLAARDTRLSFEMWRRRSGSGFGAIGDLSSVRVDRPQNEVVELRRNISEPNVMPVIAGQMPLFLPDRMRYALRLNVARQSLTDRNRSIIQNGAGEYIDQDGDIGPPTEPFTPDEYTVRTLGGGAAVSYRIADGLVAAIALDRNGNEIIGRNQGGRHDSETREERPYNIGQATLVGSIGALEWGADARGWKSSSDARWVFTISSGPGAIPLSGRGKLYDRDEEGGTLRTRARWKQGAFEVGADFGVRGRKVTIAAPRNPADMSFNSFRNQLFYRVGTDTLVVPDSVLSNETQERSWDAGAGVAWQLPGRRGVAGVEVHRFRNLTEQDVSGSGPREVTWDARAGLEFAVTSTLAVRAGYLYGKEDRDEFTGQNEFVAHSATAGFGLSPDGARWNLQLGYAYEWHRADFGDPGRPREDRQRLATQVKWTF